MPRRADINWGAVETGYWIGLLSIRRLAAHHNGVATSSLTYCSPAHDGEPYAAVRRSLQGVTICSLTL